MKTLFLRLMSFFRKSKKVVESVAQPTAIPMEKFLDEPLLTDDWKKNVALTLDHLDIGLRLINRMGKRQRCHYSALFQEYSNLQAFLNAGEFVHPAQLENARESVLILNKKVIEDSDLSQLKTLVA